VPELEPPDLHHVSAALGWLGLGVAAEARKELAKVSLANVNHPSTLEARWMLAVHEKKWDEALQIADTEIEAAPGDAGAWLHRAYALRRVREGGLVAAWGVLAVAAKKFPEESVIAYNLACYACQMKDLDRAREWFFRAMRIGGKLDIKRMALDDEDLEPLWAEIGKL
jgi:tetratricopeptide (TPR) repeat protein